MYKSLALIVLAFGLAQASTPLKGLKLMSPLASVRADASAWVDEILANLRDQMLSGGLDRITLPNFELGFSQTILGITWHGEAALQDVSLSGLETIHRTGVADLSIEPNGEIVVKVEAGVNDGSLGYTALIKFMDLGPKATVTGTLKNVRVLLGIRVGTDLRPTLETFDIKNLGTLSIDVKGLGIVLNFLAELISNAVGNVVKGVVGELLQGIIKSIINQVIGDVLFPETSKMVLQLAAIQQQVGVLHAQHPVPYIL